MFPCTDRLKPNGGLGFLQPQEEEGWKEGGGGGGGKEAKWAELQAK